jgi:3',5'-cyclic AMP phosphodiesterase CpdA
MRDPETYGREKAAELGLAIPDPAHATRHLSRDQYHHQPDDAGTGDPWVDRIDADLRAGRLDPNDYLTFRSTYMLLIEEFQSLGQDSSQQWYRQYRQIMDLLSVGGHFFAERRPNGSLDIRRLLP